MKKLMGSLLSVALMCTMVSASFAKGIFIRPGAKANSMGAAVVSTVNDATAVYWNPAGLAKIEKKSVEVSATIVAANATASVAPTQAEFPNSVSPMPVMVPLTEPTSYDSKVLETTAMLPFISGAVPMENGCVIGIGLFGVGGGGGKWSDSVPAGVATITASLDSLDALSIYNVAVAKEVSEGLLVGFGIDMVNITSSVKVKKDYSSLSVATNYGLEITKEAAGYGLEAVGGVMYAVKPNVNLGLVIRSGAELSMTGTAKATSSGLLGAFVPSNEVNYDQKYFYPMTIALGASYDPSEKVTLALGFEQINYSSMRDNFTYETQVPANGFVDENTDLDWKDIMETHIGVEYRANEEWSLMAGYQDSPTVYKHNDLTLFDTYQYNLSFLGLGAEYTKDAWNFGIGYSYPLTYKMENAGVTFEYPVDLWRVDVGYCF